MEELITNFDHFVKVFEKKVPFTRSQYEFHKKTINMRLELGSVETALHSQDFVRLLRETLKAWGIGGRASRLLPPEDFRTAIGAWEHEIAELEELWIDSPNLDVDDTVRRLWAIIEGMRIVANNATLVPSTKTLHHLLPELVVPIDRRYTQAFFMRYNQEFQYQQRPFFAMAYRYFDQIAKVTSPGQYVGQGWQTSRTKVIDNALIGYCLEKGLAGEKIR